MFGRIFGLCSVVRFGAPSASADWWTDHGTAWKRVWFLDLLRNLRAGIPVPKIWKTNRGRTNQIIYVYYLSCIKLEVEVEEMLSTRIETSIVFNMNVVPRLLDYCIFPPSLCVPESLYTAASHFTGGLLSFKKLRSPWMPRPLKCLLSISNNSFTVCTQINAIPMVTKRIFNLASHRQAVT